MRQLEQFQNDSSKGTSATVESDYSYAVVPGSTRQPEQSQTSNCAPIETMYEDVKECHPFPNKVPFMPTEGAAECMYARVSKKSKKPTSNTAVAAPETSSEEIQEEIQEPAQPAQTTVPPAKPAPYKGEAHMFTITTTTHN